MSDYIGKKFAHTFRQQTRSANHRLQLVATALANTGDVRKASTASRVLEHIIFTLPNTRASEHGAGLSARHLGDGLGLSASAISRALYTLEKAELIAWTVKHFFGVPIRHIRLLPRLVRILKRTLKPIRQIDPANPEKPLLLTSLKKTKPVINPPIEVEKAPKTDGRSILELLRRSIGGAQ